MVVGPLTFPPALAIFTLWILAAIKWRNEKKMEIMSLATAAIAGPIMMTVHALLKNWLVRIVEQEVPKVPEEKDQRQSHLRLFYKR